MTVIAGTMILIGAGCGQDQVAIPADRMNSESALSYQLGNPADAAKTAPAPAPAAPSAPDDATAAEEPAAEPAASVPSTGAAWPRPTAFPGILNDQDLRGKEAVISTNKGQIVFEFLDKEAPKASSNFIALARSGFYDGILFHRVEPGFVIQGGDPFTRDESRKADWGKGGPGYKFEDEPVSLDYVAGTVAMANAGPDTNGSQFFIVLDDQPTLPKNYTIFGRVTSGMDTVRRISVGDVMNSVVIEDKK